MALPFGHILIPLDFTEKNAAALDIAFNLAVGQNTRCTLLHVIETIEHGDGKEIEDFYAALTTEAERRLDGASRRFVDAGLAVETKIVYGRRGPEIVRCATKDGVDLVVLSSHKIDENEPARSWATLSYQIATFCPLPVLLVK